MKRWKPRNTYSTPKLSKTRCVCVRERLKASVQPFLPFIECAGKKRFLGEILLGTPANFQQNEGRWNFLSEWPLCACSLSDKQANQWRFLSELGMIHNRAKARKKWWTWQGGAMVAHLGCNDRDVWFDSESSQISFSDMVTEPVTERSGSRIQANPQGEDPWYADQRGYRNLVWSTIMPNREKNDEHGRVVQW